MERCGGEQMPSLLERTARLGVSQSQGSEAATTRDGMSSGLAICLLLVQSWTSCCSLQRAGRPEQDVVPPRPTRLLGVGSRCEPPA